MQDHRIRLSDPDLELIVASLQARLAMLTGDRRRRALKLILRLSEGAPGNPDWRFYDAPRPGSEAAAD